MGRQSRQLQEKDELYTKQQSKSKPRASRALDAFTIAEQEVPTKSILRRHRLGDNEEEFDNPSHPSKRRRMTDSGAERSGENGDSDGNEWKINEVDSADDSEIDSDEAMGSGDDETFEGYTFRGSSSGKKSKAQESRSDGEIDGASDNESDNSLGSDAVDLATAWDMNTEELDKEKTSTKKKEKSKKVPRANPLDTESGSDGDDDEQHEDEDDISDSSSELSVSDDGTDPRGLSKLQKFVQTMEQDQLEAKQPKTNLNAAAQGNRPSEYGLIPTKKLTVADLIPTISDPRMKGSLKHVDADVDTKKSGIPGKLVAPLSKRQQDRIDRTVAFEKSKETLNRWLDTVKENRKAEHLSFPLPDTSGAQQPRIEDVKPRTNLENTIQDILVQSGLAETPGESGEDKLQEFEELEARSIPLEEIQARRIELRKARALMFREESRAKRIKKIKSKSYRRVHRKEREKIALQERQAMEAAGIEPDEEERERQDRMRAEARMGAKHKDSKWAKSLKQTGRATWDEDARHGILEAAQKQEELRRRIEGKQVHNDNENFLSESSESDSDGSDSDEADGFDSGAEERRVQKDLNKLARNKNDSEAVSGPYANLMNMKFMQKARASRKAANDAELEQLRRQYGDGGDSEPDSEKETGRKRFGKSVEAKPAVVTKPQLQEFEEIGSDDENAEAVKLDVENKVDDTGSSSADAIRVKSTGSSKTKDRGEPTARRKNGLSTLPTRPTDDDNEEEVNPWLAEPSDKPRKQKKTPDPTSEIPLIGAPEEKSKESLKTTHSPKNKQRRFSDDESESDPESRPVIIQNTDLVRRAFAGDEVFADFEQEKLDTTKDEDEQVVETTLPGWGSWVGIGLNKKDKKAARRTFEAKEGVVKADRRKDARLDRVIINEKRQRKVRIVLIYSVQNR